MKICKSCEKEFQDKLNFCTQCGGKLTPLTVKEAKIEKGKKFCQECGGRIIEKAVVCPHCGVKIKSLSEKSPALAAVLSFFIFGLGQVYTGQIGKAVGMWLVVIILLAITGYSQGGAAPVTVLLLLILYIYGIYDAYRKAKE